MLTTTYNEAFNWPKSTTSGLKKWSKDRNINSKIEKNPPPIYRNSETLMQLNKECLTPFNYLLRPKPIVQTNPLQPYAILEMPKDDGNARLTRPRVYKAPEISLDDIADPIIRGNIIDYTYSTTWGLASKDAATKITKRQIPDSAWEQPYHVLFNKQEDSDDMVCKGMTDTQLNKWEEVQTRALADPTTTFWQNFRNRTPAKIVDKEAMEVRSPEYTNKILCLARKEKLRFPYNLKPPNYAGFMPEFPLEIEPEKHDLEISDPMITVYQLANRWTGQ